MSLRGPQLLKDFLASDSNSCSSTGFRSFPRHHGNKTIRNLLEIDLNTNRNRISPIKLTRSRSRAASATIYVVHRASEIFYNAVKYLPFNSVKSGREFRVNRRKHDDVRDVSVTVTVKDILRWRSFRDLVEEKSPPLRCTTGTTTIAGSNKSWYEMGDSDFTSEELPFRSVGDCSVKEVGKSFLPEESVGEGDSTANPKGDLSCEEKEQHSPVSVLNFPFQEDEESFSSFHGSSLENEERREDMLNQNMKDFGTLSTKLKPANLEDKFYWDEKYVECKEYNGDHEKDVQKGGGIEEKARQMLNHIKTRSSLESRGANMDQLLLDFFSHELATSRKQNDILGVVEEWMCGKNEKWFDWEMEGKREVYVREMERGELWRKFEEEQEEVVMEMEVGVLNYLVDELLVDLSCSLKARCSPGGPPPAGRPSPSLNLSHLEIHS